jgi:UDP:flavonoid glycosyltransferase YjiC (YdhE family)
VARIVVTTTGSGGDLFPLIPVCAELRQRGHDVVVAAPPALLRLAGPAVGDAASVGPFVARQAVQRHRAFDHRWWGYRGFDGFWQLLLEGLPRSVGDLREVVAGADLVLTHVFHPAAVIAADAEGVPLVTLNLHPAFQPSPHRPPPGLPPVGPVGNRLAWRALREVWRRRVDQAINQVRAQHGLGPLADAALLGATAGRPSLDLVDAWYASGQRSPSRRAERVGYPIWEPPRPPSTVEVPAGDDPLVVVTLGTALPLDPGSFYDLLLRALGSLPVRALVLGSDLRSPPPHLADRVAVAPFVPLSQVLPDAAVLVHHGGTGTAHTAIAFGCPSVVVPRCFDQHHQAARLSTVGAGRSLPWRRLTSARAAMAIQDVLGDRSFTEAARSLAEDVRTSPPPASRIADAIHAGELVP